MPSIRKLLCLTLIFGFASCDCGFFGSNDLGSNFALLEGDRVEDRVIVYCLAEKGDCCSGGTYIIPSYDEHYFPDGTYREYVASAKSDENWVAVKTQHQNGDIRYWLLDKTLDFDLKAYSSDESSPDYLNKLIKLKIIGPLIEDEFRKKLYDLNIKLELN